MYVCVCVRVCVVVRVCVMCVCACVRALCMYVLGGNLFCKFIYHLVCVCTELARLNF